MRPSNKSRSRNKGGNRRQHNNNSNTNIVNRVFDSAGPEGKVRGTPQQIVEKYSQLARDAQLSGDRVAAESFMQHSEHYSRMLAVAQREQAEKQAEHAARQAEQAEQQRQRNEQRAQQNAPKPESNPAEAPQPEVVSAQLVETPENSPQPKAQRKSRPRTRKAAVTPDETSSTPAE
ncbi:MAG TPA: DUF4167 domain-containing protein [Rhodobacteraceae bacterium]|nr:DUF4167 domain-containing protein [Paracoccaceae bacterium]